MVRLEKDKETTQLLVEQNRNLRKISFQDLDRRRIAEDLHEELESDPKLFGGSFNFTADFVGRLKTFMSEVVEKTGTGNQSKRSVEESVRRHEAS